MKVWAERIEVEVNVQMSVTKLLLAIELIFTIAQLVRVLKFNKAAYVVTTCFGNRGVCAASCSFSYTCTPKIRSSSTRSLAGGAI